MGFSSIFRHVSNVLIVGVVALPILILYLSGQPYKRGYFCDDQSLSHPYHHSTISATVLFVVGFVAPAIVVIVVEFILRNPHAREEFTAGRYLVQVPESVANIYHVYLGYMLGAAASQCLTDTSKYGVGRLRPHFFAVCNPSFNCEAEMAAPHIPPTFVTNFTCLGNEALFPDEASRLDAVRESRLSFVSGHASFSAQAMVFIILYLQARLVSGGGRRRAPLFLVPLAQFAALVFTFYTCLSRVNDYKHHSTDVIAGAILGTVVQVLNVVCVLRLFQKESIFQYSYQQEQPPLPPPPPNEEQRRLRTGFGTGTRVYNTSGNGPV